MAQSLSWQTPEYIYIRKSADWYWALGIVTAGLIIVAFVTHNTLFALLLILGSFALALYAFRTPRIVTITISGVGIRIDNRLFPYDALQSFWIFYHPDSIEELSLHSHGITLPYVRIPLGDTDPNHVREILIKYLPEQVHRESFIDTLGRAIGF